MDDIVSLLTFRVLKGRNEGVYEFWTEVYSMDLLFFCLRCGMEVGADDANL